jgi:membrane protein YqaA with SNARE-associated domain
MELAALVGYSVSSLAVGLASGLLPVLNTEAYLLALVALAPRDALPAAVLSVTAGQMAAKGLLYGVGSGAMSARPFRARQARVAALTQRLSTLRVSTAALVFASAVTGVPPFYLVSLAAGSLRYSLARFLLVGGSGRLLRFAALVALPRLLGAGR